MPSGRVISQAPIGGTSVAAGSAVALVISTGPAPVIVPNVVNQTQAAATSAITGAGLTVGTITTSSSATVPSGRVISQTPIGGTSVAAGSAVALVISTGPPPVIVPSVVNQTQAAATSAITGAGLTVGTITNSSSATVPAGSVISQTPFGGTSVAAGSAVALVVSTGPAPVGVGPSVDTVVFSDGDNTRTTPPFSTAAPNELLVAFVASDGPSSKLQTATVSGAGLTWTLVRRANTRGMAEVWQARATAQLTNVTVQSSLGITGYSHSLTVVAFRNASGIGASAGGSGEFAATSVTLVTTAPNSVVYGVGNDWDGADTRALGPGQAMVHQWLATATSKTFWVQSRNTAVPSAGTTIQLNSTAPADNRWNFVAVEIVP